MVLDLTLTTKKPILLPSHVPCPSPVPLLPGQVQQYILLFQLLPPVRENLPPRSFVLSLRQILSCFCPIEVTKPHPAKERTRLEEQIRSSDPLKITLSKFPSSQRSNKFSIALPTLPTPSPEPAPQRSHQQREKNPTLLVRTKGKLFLQGTTQKKASNYSKLYDK